MKATKVILDTDIGLDIDDALALAYLLKNPNCDLVGVTTFCGCAQLRAQLVSAICIAAGKDHIPIYPGTDDCILIDQREMYAPQSVVLEKWEHKENFPEHSALDFMRQTIYENPGEVILITIGPPSNIARLFLMDPKIPSMLKGFYLMGGKFGGTQGHMWTQRYPDMSHRFSGFEPDTINEILQGGALDPNGCIDPYATAIVHGYSAPIHRSVGEDITSKVVMDRACFRRAMSEIGSPLHHIIMEMGTVFLDEAETVTFHDPLAAVSIFKDVCEFTKGRISVELQSQYLRGYTYFQEDKDGPHEVASSVDCGAFFDEFFSVLNR